MAGTFDITSNPTNTASMNTVSSVNRCALKVVLFNFGQARPGWRRAKCRVG